MHESGGFISFLLPALNQKTTVTFKYLLFNKRFIPSILLDFLMLMSTSRNHFLKICKIVAKEIDAQDNRSSKIHWRLNY